MSSEFLCILVTDYQNGRWIIYTERGVEKMDSTPVPKEGWFSLKSYSLNR